MLVLFETPAGFALFKVLDEGKLDKVEVMRPFFYFPWAVLLMSIASIYYLYICFINSFLSTMPGSVEGFFNFRISQKGYFIHLCDLKNIFFNQLTFFHNHCHPFLEDAIWDCD